MSTGTSLWSEPTRHRHPRVGGRRRDGLSVTAAVLSTMQDLRRQLCAVVAHVVAAGWRRGLGTNSPAQLGQVPANAVVAHSGQKVHS